MPFLYNPQWVNSKAAFNILFLLPENIICLHLNISHQWLPYLSFTLWLRSITPDCSIVTVSATTESLSAIRTPPLRIHKVEHVIDRPSLSLCISILPPPWISITSNFKSLDVWLFGAMSCLQMRFIDNRQLIHLS